MVGKWIVYEGAFSDRWIFREIIGETDKFLVVQPARPDGSTDELDPRRVKKSSIGKHRTFDSREAAKEIAQAATKELADLKDRYDEQRSDILRRYF